MMNLEMNQSAPNTGNASLIPDMNPGISRRQFVKTATAGAVAASFSGSLFGHSHASHTLKVGVVGTGWRGDFLLERFIKASEILGKKVKIVALADAFESEVTRVAKKYEVDPALAHFGFDSYQKVMESDAQYVILAAPPNFRPLHMDAAVAAGKHAMVEKPIAVDAPGVRQFIAAGELAKTKGLAVVPGTQRRHQLSYLRNKAMIDAGAVGTILAGVVSWNGTVPWIYKRQPGWSDAEYMARNWVNFTEMSGDHIVEQHVHNIDVANWFLGRTPVSALGFGGRARRETGNQFDFFSVDFDYGDGIRIHSQCRQLSGAHGRVGEYFRGTEGEVFGGGRVSGKTVSIPELLVDSDEPETQEMVDLIRSVEKDNPLNGSLAVAHATAAAIMGRISAYTGAMVRWSDLLLDPNSDFYHLKVGPDARDFETGNVVAPPEDVVPVPGDGAPVHIKT